MAEPTPATDVSARLAAIRDRHDEYLRLKKVDDGSDRSFWTVMAQAAHFAVNDVPALLDIVESVLETKPSMHGDHGPIPGDCRYCEGEAAGLAKVRELIHNHLTYDEQETPDA